MAAKVTYTLDDSTVQKIEDASERLAKPKSQIVREAVQLYHSRIERLSPTEVKARLELFDRLLAKIPPRPQSEVDAELREIRRARRSGGRLTRSEISR